MTQQRKIGELTLSQFLEAVASGSATPGGGSVSALAGCMASALVEMVANLTLGRKGFEAKEEEIKKIGREAHELGEALMDAMEQDIAAYGEVMTSYLLPKSSEEERKKRREEIQKALKKAADPPLFTAATSLKVLKLCQDVVEKGNPNALSDGAVGALLADAAMWGGVFNVLINLSALDDRHYVRKIREDLRGLEQEGEGIKDQIMARVKERLIIR